MIYYNHQIKVHVNILKAALTKGLQEKPFFYMQNVHVYIEGIIRFYIKGL